MTRKYAFFAALACALLCAMSCGKNGENGGDPIIDPVVTPSNGELCMELPNDETLVVQSYSAPVPPFDYDEVYEYDPTDFPNPERGPYSARSYSYIDGKIPAVSTVESMAATRANGTSLIFTFFYLCDFLNDPISQPVLDHMRQHFINLRASGCKTVLRCAYSWYWNTNDRTQQEPDIDLILTHIEQMKPIVREFADVIYVWQAGFVGTYGEWAYTTNIKTDEERAAVIKGMLDALPESRMVAIRTPMHKRRVLTVIEGQKITVKDSITVETAFNGSYRSRISSFNDCAFVNGNDGGTYGDGTDRKYVRIESNYVMNGGESCYQGDNTYCECIPAYKNLRTFHWQYLSNHHDIINVWKSMGCYEDATARVGYRFVLNGSAFDSDWRSGSDLTLRLCLTNYGWGSLINPHVLEFILVSDSNPQEKYVFTSSTDPRIWKGSHIYTHTERIVLPEGLRTGAKYNLYINVADSEPTIHDRADYSVRFANKNIWDPQTGYNLLTTFIAQ